VTLSDNQVTVDVFTGCLCGCGVQQQERRHRQTLVSVTRISISGTDAGNHVQHHDIDDGEHHRSGAAVCRRPGSTKVYDGTTTASITPSDDQVSKRFIGDLRTRRRRFQQQECRHGRSRSGVWDFDLGDGCWELHVSTRQHRRRRTSPLERDGVCCRRLGSTRSMTGPRRRR